MSDQRLSSNQFSDLGCDFGHGLLGGTQASPGGQQKTNPLKLFVGCSMNNRDESLSPKERRKFLVCNAFCRQPTQHSRSY